MAITFADESTKRIKESALEYHARSPHGKIEVVPTKPCATQRDLALAYSPGVAEPCLEIERDPEQAWSYTSRGNLVAVISNGTAVLGLGDIGALAGKPVMEGKGVLFKRFAGIDVFDLEVDTKDVDLLCRVVKSLEPTFGGINLEDIKAPECFVIEERLKREMNIPVFHDDQHGTAIISGAALLNALSLVDKAIDKVKVVVSGAGASAIACTNFYIALGVRRENVLLVDTRGVVYEGRKEGMNEYKAAFARPTHLRTLEEAMVGADVFLGCSVKGLVKPKMLLSMARDPIVFALANPDPEITYPEAIAARPDVIMATGRSDYPNQVNNVLGFPFIFRGALDVRARAINEEMKLAAARALAALAREEVPEQVSRAYGGERFKFGREYIIPKPFDDRVLVHVAPAIAKAAMESGVARLSLNLEEYRDSLKKSQSRSRQVMSGIVAKARTGRSRIVFPEGNQLRILQAARILRSEGICEPVLLSEPQKVLELIEEHHLDELRDVEIINPDASERFESYAQLLFQLRQRAGMTMRDAKSQTRARNNFAALMLKQGDADGVVTGLTMTWLNAVRPALEIIGTKAGKDTGGVFILATKQEVKFLADCTLNIDPTPERLARIAIDTAELASSFDITPRIAMLSYSTFGSAKGQSPAKMRRAAQLVREARPDLEVEGEIGVDAALDAELRGEVFPFARLSDDANILVFPSLDAANISFKLLRRTTGASLIGPVLLNMALPINVMQMGAEVEEIVYLAALTALKAQGERQR